MTTIAATPLPSPPTVPDEYRHPTADQLEFSVTAWSTDGSVRGLARTEEDSGETVVSLRSDILFAFASAEVSPEAAAAISDLVKGIPAGTVVSVTGHTDDIGTDADNVILSEARARAVAAAMGRDDISLEVSGRGESEPVASNADPAGRQENRRVEIRY